MTFENFCRYLGRARTHPRSRLAATPISAVDAQVCMCTIRLLFINVFSTPPLINVFSTPPLCECVLYASSLLMCSLRLLFINVFSTTPLY